MTTRWNTRQEPITERLGDPEEILRVVKDKTLMYNKRSGETAIISEVFLVDQDENSIKQGYTIDEDRWVEYITATHGPKEDFAVDHDDDDWVWHDEIEEA
jgi:hypothetical protein